MAIWAAEKVLLATPFRVRQKYFFLQSLLEGGGRHLFIFAAEIRVRAAFIYADLDIHEGCGGSRRGAGGPEKLTINFTRPNYSINSHLFNSHDDIFIECLH